MDVEIIGGGITALTAALLLAERGQRVAVFAPEEQASDAGTGEITVAADARYRVLRRRHGDDGARVVADASRAAVARIAELVQRYSIDCGFRRVPGYLYTEKRRYVAELKSEAAAAREVGLDAQFVTEVALPFPIRGAVLWPDQAQFDPRRYLTALRAHATAAGVRFESESATPAAGAVIFDTTFIPEGATAHTTHHIAFDDDGAYPEGVFRDTADLPHATLRRDGLLIVSGEDLDDYARQYHASRTGRDRWSTTIVRSPDGLPLIGRADGRYVAGAYGTQTATFATLAAMIVTDLILGTPNPWAAVFGSRPGEDVPRHFG